MKSAAPHPLEIALARDKNFRAKAQPGLAGKALDRIAREVSPRWARSRQLNRAFLALGDGYDIVKGGRSRRARSYSGGTADKHLQPRTLFMLRETCRDADRNSPLVHGILERWCDNVIGPTFQFEPMTDDEGWNKAAREYIEGRMGKSSDIRRRLTFRRRARLILRSIATDGDSLNVFTDQGLATYEADQLASPWGQAKESADQAILNGVRVDPATGRDLGYYVTKRQYKGFLAEDFDRETTYIPAAETFFPANLLRTSQTRGVPILASSLGTFDHLDGYLGNEQTAAEVASCLIYMITRADPNFFTDPASGELYPWVHTETSEDGTEQQLVKSEPGMIINGMLGDRLELFNPARPGATFEPYVVLTLRIIGAGIGMPLELVLLDFSKTNYSSARASLLQAYRTFMVWQQFAVTEVLTPPYERWIGQAIVDGDLSLREDAFRVKWLMPRWPWVDPLKEILAAEKATALGVDLLADTIEAEGQTLEDYVRRRAKELALYRQEGIPTTSAPLNTASPTPIDPTVLVTEGNQ